MDSGFKNDQLRQLNLRIGYPNDPLQDEYEKETIFEYLHAMNKELSTYHEILENIKNEISSINAKMDTLNAKVEDIKNNTAETVTQLTVNTGQPYENYRVADVVAILCNNINQVIGYVDIDKKYFRVCEPTYNWV